jgi:hypothetical protein
MLVTRDLEGSMQKRGERRQSGIAIITVLVVLVAIAILGAGAIYLTRVNLTIAGNARANATARSNAETGIQAALVRLENAFRASYQADPLAAELPATLTLPSVSGPGFSPQFSLVSYARDSVNSASAVVRVSGTGPASAEHVSEVLVVMFPGEPEFPPGFSFGLASEGQIFVNGSSSYINAGIHGNDGFSLTGNVGDDFFVCTDRNPTTGVCTATEAVPLADAPVSASPGATLCSPADLCDAGIPQTLVAPIDVNPAFVPKRLAAVSDASSTSGSATTVTFGSVDVACDIVINSAPTAAQLATLLPVLASRPDVTLCNTSNGTLTFPANFDTNGMNIISNGAVAFPRSGGSQATIRNSIVVTFSGSVTAANERATISSSRIFSEGSINFNGQQTVVTGVTTIASNGSIVVNGGAPAVTSTDGPAVGFALIATGNVTINGSADWYVAASVGGTFTQNGTSTVYGVIEAEDTITINGGIDIDSGLPIDNDDTQTDGPPRIAVVSAR